ncbi:MAG: hypothetical protein O7D30_10855, partial [Rickettsia endosymbiont of Ixodes persulcatus]|nr:hypothetical protein [Rickettsia endosymbiont of Ixodes persulcatus]
RNNRDICHHARTILRPSDFKFIGASSEVDGTWWLKQKAVAAGLPASLLERIRYSHRRLAV